MLIDASFLGFVTADLKRNFERMLGRRLQDMQLDELITYIALDAGIREEGGEKQVFLIYDDESACLPHCHPSDLKRELDNTAFRNKLGEFSFFSFQPEGMATREDLYIESLRLTAGSEEIKRLIVVSFNEEYGEKVDDILRQAEGKEVIQFRMNEPERPVPWRWEMLAYPVMQALGIRGDEL